MSGIYRIWNDVNNKSYIGQTIRANIEDRIKEHFRNYDKPYYDVALYRAMKKYGLEHFHYEILENNNFSEDFLDELEQYYILEFDSFYNGYNETLGGQYGRKRIDAPKEEIIELYKKTNSCRKVAKHFNIFHETVSRILKENGIEINSRGHGNSKPVILEDIKTGERHYFGNNLEAAKFCIELGCTWSKQPVSVRANIKEGRLNPNKIIYGRFYVKDPDEEIVL